MRRLAPIVVLLLASPGCSSESCTEIGCSSSTLISGELPSASGPIDVEACANQRCTSLSGIDPAGCHVAQGSSRLELCFVTAEAGLTLNVTVHHDPGDPALADGDVYTLKVQDAGGASLVDFTGTATYSDYRPNGAGCDPVCKSAELSF